MADNSTEPTPLLVLDFGDGKRGEFKAHRFANQFLMVKHIDNMFSGGYDGLVAATTLAMDQVLPEEKEALEQFLYENGRSDQYIIAVQNGLNGVWSGETNLPLESSQDSSETTSPQDGDQSSTEDSSSPATPEETRLESRGGLSLFPGLPLRSVLMATYAVLRELSDEPDELDGRLGFESEEVMKSTNWTRWRTSGVVGCC